MNFKIGDKVICTNDFSALEKFCGLSPSKLKVGEIYTVDDILSGEDSLSDEEVILFYLKEMDDWFDASNFQKISSEKELEENKSLWDEIAELYSEE